METDLSTARNAAVQWKDAARGRLSAERTGARASPSYPGEVAATNLVCYFRRLGFSRVESCLAQAVLPMVGLAANKIIRDRYISGGWVFPGGKLPRAGRPPDGRTRGGQNHPRPVYFRRVGFFQMESCPTQSVLPMVGLAADKIIRARSISGG